MTQPAKPRTRTVSSREAKQHWDAMIAAASEGEDVVVEVSGKAKTVMISVEEYEEYQTLRERQQREHLLRRLEAFERRQAERNKDLTDEQIEELADRASRESFEELAAEEKLVFERDGR